MNRDGRARFLAKFVRKCTSWFWRRGRFHPSVPNLPGTPHLQDYVHALVHMPTNLGFLHLFHATLDDPPLDAPGVEHLSLNECDSVGAVTVRAGSLSQLGDLASLEHKWLAYGSVWPPCFDSELTEPDRCAVKGVSNGRPWNGMGPRGPTPQQTVYFCIKT